MTYLMMYLSQLKKHKMEIIQLKTMMLMRRILMHNLMKSLKRWILLILCLEIKGLVIIIRKLMIRLIQDMKTHLQIHQIKKIQVMKIKANLMKIIMKIKLIIKQMNRIIIMKIIMIIIIKKIIMQMIIMKIISKTIITKIMMQMTILMIKEIIVFLKFNPIKIVFIF